MNNDDYRNYSKLNNNFLFLCIGYYAYLYNSLNPYNSHNYFHSIDEEVGIQINKLTKDYIH